MCLCLSNCNGRCCYNKTTWNEIFFFRSLYGDISAFSKVKEALCIQDNSNRKSPNVEKEKYLLTVGFPKISR